MLSVLCALIIKRCLLLRLSRRKTRRFSLREPTGLIHQGQPPPSRLPLPMKIPRISDRIHESHILSDTIREYCFAPASSLQAAARFYAYRGLTIYVHWTICVYKESVSCRIISLLISRKLLYRDTSRLTISEAFKLWSIPGHSCFI